jgi:hypothetical protein
MKHILPALAFGLSCATLAVSVRADDVPAQVQALVAKQSPSVVTVRAVLKISSKEAGAQNSESRTEMQGVVVDPSGLIMVSSLPFSVNKLMEMMGAPPDAMSDAPTITPSDFKVVFSNEDTEYPAFLAATDTTLGLTFLKIGDLKGRTLTAVTFGTAPAPALGESVFALTRLGKGYDYAPAYESAHVTGIITKPRAAMMLDGGISEVGLPVFSANGDALGVLTTVPSGIKADSSSAGMMSMLTGLLGGRNAAQGSLFLVPGSAISPVIAEAQTRAAALAAQHAATPAAPPVTPAPPVTAPAK